MFENPGDEVYFGEVYRQVLQEPWLPGGGDIWEVIGKSRRGRRPSQMGITGPNVSPSQEEVRRYFSKCAAAWLDLPWDIPPGAFCDNRNDRKYWKDEKDRRGLMCSYYDLYMRYCLRFALDTGCMPPANYLLKIGADLSAVECNKVYDLAFSNNCGDVSFVSGEGEFIPPNEWVAPKFGTEGDLCFKDENGAFGFASYKFSPLHWFKEFIWPDVNPDEVNPSDSETVYVEGGVPPYSWTVTGLGFSLASEITDVPSNTLLAGPGAAGTAFIEVTDICGFKCSGYVRSTAGQWVEKGSSTPSWGPDAQAMYSSGCAKGTHLCNPTGSDWELIIGYQRWLCDRELWCAVYSAEFSLTDNPPFLAPPNDQCGGPPVSGFCCCPDNGGWVDCPCDGLYYPTVHVEYYEWEP